MKNDRAEESFPNRVQYLFGVSSTLQGFLIMQGHGFEQLLVGRSDRLRVLYAWLA